MTRRPDSARAHSGVTMPGLSPLMMAILTAFPGAAAAAGATYLPSVARPAAPAVNAVPVPQPKSPAFPGGWIVSTSVPGAPSTLTNSSNAAGGVNQTINQSSVSAVYNWQSFDIGAGSSVTFNYPSASGSSLNRVTGSSVPSAIFGALNSQYPNPDVTKGGMLSGGSIYLINANGILFGKTSQVDTGALIASTLDLQNTDFYAGLSQSITGAGWSFGPFAALGATPGSLLPGANNFVIVDPGAQISTPSGGRVFLFANNTVQNGGTITTPNGQTALAAGDQVYLNVPTAEAVYASEVNPSIPAVNGLLVEVGSGNGSVANLQGGVINTPTGNTTLVGMAVNQSGRISATTSVSQNGSVLLLARGSAQAQVTNGVVTKEATVSGALTLGPGSSIEIAPDTSVDAKGQQLTSNANSIFTPSLVELAGQTIELQPGASIVAHGGVVEARAETVPSYVLDPSLDAGAYATGDAARLVIGANATIDVSGTTSTTVSAARNFVTTALLGASDLADAPLQRTGPIYRSELTFDVRSAVPILGDTSAYVKAIEKTATEQLSVGGTIKLSSTGAVVTNAASALDIAGGIVKYTAATVTPSELIGSDGHVYTFNQAPAGLTYTAVLGSPSGALDRWGVVPAFTPSQVSNGILTPGYSSGQAGGSLKVMSPLTVLDGQITAGVTLGARQGAGLDPLAGASQLTLGARSNDGNAFGTSSFISAGLGDLNIAAAPGVLGNGYWSNPLTALLPAASRIAASTLNASGLGQITITSDGGIALQPGANLVLPASAVVDLAAGGAKGIDLGADIRSAGGTVAAQTRAADGGGPIGMLTLDAGTRLDVSATWVNRAIDGPTTPAATAGGSVSLSAGAALDVQDASTIDVSGAATVAVNGTVAPTAAGSVALQSNLSALDTDAPSRVHVGAHIVANSLAGGGSLTLSADSIAIQPGVIAGGVADGAAVGSLVLSNQFFEQGAFSSYRINALSSLAVASGTTLQPQVSNWILTPGASAAATGAAPSSFLDIGTLPASQRAPASVLLSAASAVGNAYGDLTLAPGAHIVTDPLGSVTLDAGLNLALGGTIVAPGGNVNLALVGSAKADTPASGTLTLGPRAGVDVSGVVVLQPQTGLLPAGQVLAGGHVAIGISASAALTPIVVAPGAVIAADGTSAVLGVITTNAPGVTVLSAQTVASAGGSVSIAAGDGGVLAGSMHALGGNATVSGGLLDVSGVQTMVVQQSSVSGSAPVAGIVAVSAQDLAHNFSDATLQATHDIHFSGDVALAMAGNLAIDAPVLSATPGNSNVALSGGSTLSVGASYQQVVSAAGAIGGGAKLTLNGGLVELSGHQVLQGFGSVGVAASSELRLQSVAGVGGAQGDLGLQGTLKLSAPQIVPTTASQYVIDAPGQSVLLTGGDAKTVTPLSAGGAITINASDITTIDPANPAAQAVVRAPFGALTFNATNSVTIGAGSVLSVSGAGMTVPFGQTSDAANWSYDASAVAIPPQKSISLNAPAGSIAVAAGATLDLSGGGNLVAQEFVPGAGGSRNIFAGAANGAFAVIPASSVYAAQDLDILHAQPDASGKLATVQLGRDITFGVGGPIPAGTYAILPAQYATLAGAYLVTPTTSSAPLALGAAVKQVDGSVLVGGRIGEAGTAFSNALTQSFKVLTSTQALTYSEIDQANANTFFAAQSAAAGQPVPALPTDAGLLDIAANQLALKGATLFKLPTVTTGSGTSAVTTTVGRGGELDIAASDIQVGGSAPTGVLSLDPKELNATGATLVVLGGHLDPVKGSLGVTANTVVLDNAGAPLAINDLMLVANDSVTLKPGSAIAAPAAATDGTAVIAPSIALSGDGALLRVSSDVGAASTRTGVMGTAGALSIGAGATISGAAITAEGTQSNTIAADATLSATAITLGAGHMAVGDVPADASLVNTLVLTPALATQVAGAQSLTLRSATGIDLYGAATLGGTGVRALTIDTGSISLIGDGAAATIAAGGVTLTNTSGTAGLVASGTNVLQVRADGSSGGSGQILVGSGAVTVAGASQVLLSASHEVVLGDGANLSTAGDLSMSAAALQAARGATASLVAGGAFTLTRSGTPLDGAPGLGAQVTINAQTITQAGQLLLPSGQLALSTTGPSDAQGNAVHFASGSLTDLSGRATSIDGIAVATPGGTLAVNAAAGNVALDTGATLNVSAPATGAQAGAIAVAAPGGAVTLAGSLLGTAAADQHGGGLSVDSLSAIDLAALATTLQAQANNFSGALTLRNRSGDQTLAAGSAFSAQSISLSADNGNLAIRGSLDAGGASGVSVVLAGGAGLQLDAGAAINAHSTGASGSQVQLLSGNLQLQADGTFAGSQGGIAFNGGTIALGGADSGANGTLLVRAQRGADGTGLAIGGSGVTQLTGAGQIELESVRQYGATTVDKPLIAQVVADNALLGGNATQQLSRAAALLGVSPSALQLRSGVEIDSTGDLAMVGDPVAGGWNLTSFAPNGVVQAQASGAPMDLTLRAQGNLSLLGSISDGFTASGVVPPTAAVAGKIQPAAVVAQVGGAYVQGANINLVGGADLSAANVTATIASDTRGDVVIGGTGKNVLVRTTTGNIGIAAGRDVTLGDALADVYTTGTPVTTLPGYVGNNLGTAAYLRSGTTNQSPFLAGGGDLAVHAGRDIVGVDPNTATLQFATDWAWRAVDQKTGGQPMWWNRYDQFQQGFATFGGGDVSASAARDVVNADFSAASSGYVARNADGSVGASVGFGGGDVDVHSGRDVLGSFVLASGATGSVLAGRDIAAGTSPYALQALYGNTALDIVALDNLDLGLVSSFGMLPATKEYTNGALSFFIQGLTPQATLRAQAASGDLAYESSSPADGATTHSPGASALPDRVIPDTASFTAPQGSIDTAQLIQDPAGTTRLSLLAHGDLTLAGITVSGTDGNSATPTILQNAAASVLDSLDISQPGRTALDTGVRTPMELVAQTGDVTVNQGILTTTSMRMIAGRDIVMVQPPDAVFRGITLQSQATGELSLLQAGRDITFASTGVAFGGVEFYGPGDLLMIAGRNIDLSSSGGVRADGNRQNSVLTPASGNVTIAAGLALAAGDYSQALAWYFPLLGGSGIAGFAPELVAQLTALKAGQDLPAPGSGAAQQYAALPVASQLAQVQTLVGLPAFNAAVLADAQRRAGSTNVTMAQAQASFAALDAGQQSEVAGAALSTAWLAAVPAAQQAQQALAFADSLKTSYLSSLQKFVTAQGAPADLDGAQALAAFQALPVDRQMLFTNQVLVDVVRQAGRTASQLDGADKTAAYQTAYAALDTVFPAASTSGNLTLGASQIESLQDSNITVLAPRGSVDVGTLVAGINPKPPKSLGIVTADGGDISMIVDGSVNVDQSRVFTVGVGSLLMWASNGNLDAGRGGKTVVGAPAPVYYLNAQGQFVIDTSGSFSGSGIAVLNAASSLDLYAPKGEINAGDAGIKSLGNAYFGAAQFVGADNLSVGGVAVGAPPPASTGGATAGLAAVAQNAAAATNVNAGDSEEEKERKRRKRLNLVLDFLGFGDGSSKP